MSTDILLKQAVSRHDIEVFMGSHGVMVTAVKDELNSFFDESICIIQEFPCIIVLWVPTNMAVASVI